MERRTIQQKPDKIKTFIHTSKFDKYINNNKKNINIEYGDVFDEENIEEQDNFDNYIISTSLRKFSSNADFCLFNWNGIEFLDKWELQRAVDIKHAEDIANSLNKRYKKYKEFIFYDPIHICKKKDDNKYYVLDGQHRLEAYYALYLRNKYPIQQIPAVIWNVDNDEEFIELFNRINTRLSIDKIQLMQVKILEIIQGLEKKYGQNIWSSGERPRPKINKEIFCAKLKENKNTNKLSSIEIIDKLIKINNNIRSKPRILRTRNPTSSNIHSLAEEMDLFLGLDKEMNWMNEL